MDPPSAKTVSMHYPKPHSKSGLRLPPTAEIVAETWLIISGRKKGKPDRKDTDYSISYANDLQQLFRDIKIIVLLFYFCHQCFISGVDK